MFIKSAKLTFHIHYANSLKDKRQIRRSMIEKARHRFNVSIAEVATQDVYRTLTIGIAVVSGDAAHAQNSLDEVIRFLENNEQAELTDIKYD